MDQSNKVINVHQSEIKQLLKEIKDLEQKLKKGNRNKKYMAALGGIALAGLGAAAAGIYAAPYLLAEAATEAVTEIATEVVTRGVTEVATEVAISTATEAAPALISSLSTLLSRAPELVISNVSQWGITEAGLVAGDLALGVIGARAGYRWGADGTQDNQKKIQDIFLEILKQKIEFLKSAKNQIKIDFVFNEESSLYTKYQKKTEQTVLDEIKARKIKEAAKEQKVEESYEIIPHNWADYRKELQEIFRSFSIKKIAERPIIEKIEIKNAEMNDEQLGLLLFDGLGSCGTKTLDLSNNRLTDASIAQLKNHILKEKKGFSSLKSLNLSNNNLTGACLPAIEELVAFLKIEELDLSGNALHPGDEKLMQSENNNYLGRFIKDRPTTMFTLEVLKIANTNITDKLADKLEAMLTTSDLLVYLNISGNAISELALRKIHNAVLKNQTFRELITDYGTLKIVENRSKKQPIPSDPLNVISSQFKEKSDSPYIIKLNRYAKCKQRGANMESMNSEEIEPFDEVVMKISLIRNETLGVPENFDIKITKDEYINYRQNDLSDFYVCAVQSNEISNLDPRLFENTQKMEEIRAKQDNLMKIFQDMARQPEPVMFSSGSRLNQDNAREPGLMQLGLASGSTAMSNRLTF